MSKCSGDSALHGYGPVEVSVVPSKTPGHICLRLLAPGRPVSVHLSAQQVWEVIAQMHQGLADSMRDEAALRDVESALYEPVSKSPPPWANLSILDQRIHAALTQQRLDLLVRDLYSEGWTEGEVYGALDRLRAVLSEQDRRTDETTVLDVLDRIMGFCSPHQRLQRS